MLKNSKNKIFIIDGSSFLYRAYYSIPELKTNNISVNAVYGFCKMIKSLIDKHDPKYMLLVWDSSKKTLRHEIYPEYKQNRQSAPETLFSQKDIIIDFANIIDLKQLSIDKIEADDLMFSAAEKFKEESVDNLSVIVTSDKDLSQSINEQIIILDPFKDKIISQENFNSIFDFDVDKLIFYYSLIGDSSDNIKGVKGIGPKTAKDLINKYKSLEDLYLNLDKLSSERVKSLLIKDKESAFISKELFTLKKYNLEIEKKDCLFDKENFSKATDFFKKYKFNSFIKNIDKVNINLHEKYKFNSILNIKDLDNLCKLIEKHKAFAIDTETDGLDIFSSNLVGISIAFELGTSYYIPFGHKDQKIEQQKIKQLDKDLILNRLKYYLEDQNIKKYLHNSKFDLLMLKKENINLTGIEFDTIIAANLLSTVLLGENSKLGLKYLSDYLFNEPMLNFQDIVKKNNYKDFSFVDIETATKYAAADAHQTLKLYQLFKPELKKLNMEKLFYDLEMPLIEILSDIERNGIFLDINIIQDIDKKVSEEIEKVYKEIINNIDEKYCQINLNSQKQLEELLFYNLNLPAIKKTGQKKSYSTDQEVLKELSKIHYIPRLIIKYRELFKLKTTYLQGLIKHVNPKTDKLHTNFSQTTVLTGRLSSHEPNLQNIPVDNFLIRSAFKPKENYLFISADYSQIELKVLAYLSKDKILREAFINNQDIHTITACKIFATESEVITNEQRQFAKRINFGILYGLTAHGLSKELDLSHNIANDYIKKFWSEYKELDIWMEEVIKETKEKGYVETLFKRRRYIPGINEKNRNIYELSKRIAINTIIQGTAAEIVKLGMIKLYNAIKENNLDAKIILQIHDELIIEVHKDIAEETALLTKNILESIVDWEFKLLINIKIGKNWQEVT